MSLVDLPAAKAHLRLEAAYPDDQVAPTLAAAEGAAASFLNRRIFETQDALTTALAGVPDALIAAADARRNALTAAAALPDCDARAMATKAAEAAYAAAQEAARATYAGIVVNAQIRAGILLILGHLFENRSDVEVGVSVAEVPMTSQYVLQPFRVDMGI